MQIVESGLVSIGESANFTGCRCLQCAGGTEKEGCIRQNALWVVTGATD